ncbi:hypothetical protein [Paraburkholderia sp. MM5384-R2]|nr:hypothetical protein [Paraburkholderia sp. MM5384-R2]MBB5503701.1 hypothetical protein [Paraburkholderia sp. MM5384-R2]
MTDIGPESTFRGLPLTAEQDAEVRHYADGLPPLVSRGLPFVALR